MLDRRGLIATFAWLGLAGPGAAQQPAGEPERRLREDWADLQHYAQDNARIIASGTRPDIVFLGDSITHGWRSLRPDFFTPGRLNRGISGQTSPQMLVRTMPDVVALRPRVLHLMAGTNDVAGNTGATSVEQTVANLTAICQIARANGIAVLLASVPPADHFPWRPAIQPVAAIRAINIALPAAAKAAGARYIDYTPALATAGGAMRPGLAGDGVHPTAAGFAAMESVLEPVLRRLRV